VYIVNDEKMSKILIVEDEVKLARFVELELKHEGYEVIVANDGRTGLDCFETSQPDAVLLDLMLPELSGIEVCRRIRRVSDVPVIMLTAKGETMDKVIGLDSGADDYMTKPFAIEELLARLRAALRRRVKSADAENDSTLTLKGLTIDVARHTVKYEDKVIELTKREFELLEYLVRNKNIVLTRDQILNKVWGYDYIGETNVVDVYVRYLRTKIDDKFDVKLIHTIRGVGYYAKDEE
jgi:DNA-binding response OmpR family regulator